jgi:MarR family transcriptional regulator, organic hydroperoxide resistance regulator
MKPAAGQNLNRRAEELNRDLRAIRAALRRPIKIEMARGNLTGPQQSAMAVLVRSGPLSLKALAAQLGLAHSTASGIVHRLEERGMVRRGLNAADRRLTRIVVTREVKEWLKRTMPELGVAPLLAALRRAKPAEREAIMAAVKALRRLLDESSP